MEAIDVDQPEGIYLRRCRSLSKNEIPPQLHRIRWYRELADALCHLHSFGIAHADIRFENILFDHQDAAILCDFSAASSFGQANSVFPDIPLPINGLFPTLSEATDMFAMASLIFQMEHGVKPELSIDSNGVLVLPEIRTDNQHLDIIIRKAWLRRYSLTTAMFNDLESIDAGRSFHPLDTKLSSRSTESLRDKIREWREHREDQFGRILDGILSESQLQGLADCYGLDKDADLRFIDNEVHL